MQALGIILAHLVGDYVIQTDHMANEKTRRWWPAILHGLTYTIPYLFVTQSPLALFVIAATHVVIDRYRLAKHLCWAKNQLAPKSYRYAWKDANGTGYPADRPIWMTTWLLIIADNATHLAINAAAVLWLS